MLWSAKNWPSFRLSRKPRAIAFKASSTCRRARAGAGAQIVLIDTPGVHKPDSSLGRKMMVEVREALEGCDVVLLIMDVTRKLDQRDEFAIQMLKHSSTKVCLILNKVDLLKGGKAKLLPLIEEYKKLHDFHEIIPISALKRDGLDILLKQVTAALPAGPPLFPEDQVTDQPARFMAGEIVRERVLVETEEELPYATTVIVENFEEGARLTRIRSDDLLRARRAEGHPDRQEGPDAETHWDLGALADRAHVGHKGVS